MKKFLKDNLILLLVCAIGLGCAFASIGSRIQVESRDKTYDLVLDTKEMRLMAAQSDYDEDWWYTHLNREFGIDKLGLWEDTLDSLEKEFPGVITASMMKDIKRSAPDWTVLYPESFTSMFRTATHSKEQVADDYDVIVAIYDEKLFNYVLEGFESRYNNLNLMSSSGWSEEENRFCGYIYLDGSEETCMYSEVIKITGFDAEGLKEDRWIYDSVLRQLNIGFRKDMVKHYESLGYTVVPRSIVYDGFNTEAVAKDMLSDYLSTVGETPYLVIGGAVYGYEDDSSAVYDYLQKHAGTSLCLIEATDQSGNMDLPGLRYLASQFGDRVVRTYSVWDYIQNRYAYFGYEGPEEIQNTIYRAVTERNIRMVYFKPIKETDEDYWYITDPDDYDLVFSVLKDRLDAHGLSLGTAVPAKELHTPFAMQICMTFASVAAAILLLQTLIPVGKKGKYILAALGILGVIGCYYVAPNASAMIGALAAAIIWPCLACAFYMIRGRKIWDSPETLGLGKILLSGVWILAVGALLALIGGFTAAAPFSDNTYLVEQALFRGVKISQIVPMLYAIACYMAWYGFRKDKEKIGRLEWRDISGVLNVDIKIWMGVVLLAIAGVAVIYILRTGHTSNLNTNTLEVQLRNFLEEHLPARPRTKEFLFAYPCLMLFIYAVAHKQRFFSFCFGLAGVVGYACNANTYMHLRTPIYLSLERLAASLPIGIVLGAVCVIVYHFCVLLWNRYLKEKLEL